MDAIAKGLLQHDMTATFNILSEGSKDDFASMLQGNKQNIKLHLNQTMLEAWQSMVVADILVLSPSSFSYSAALYNTGVIVYSKFWHRPLPSWLTFQGREGLADAVSRPQVGKVLRARLAHRNSPYA